MLKVIYSAVLCGVVVTSTFAADFTATITDAADLAGITWARERHNAANPAAPFATDQDYMANRILKVAQSYARAQAQEPLDAAKAKCAAGDCADAKAMGAK